MTDEISLRSRRTEERNVRISSCEFYVVPIVLRNVVDLYHAVRDFTLYTDALISISELSLIHCIVQFLLLPIISIR